MSESYLGPVLRTILLVLLLGLSSFYWVNRIDKIREGYQTTSKEAGMTTAEKETWKSAVAEMTSQNHLIISWGVLLLGGLVALVITTNVHPIRRLEWIYLLLAPAGSLLLGSVWSGVVFQRRAAYLVLNGQQGPLGSLNALLGAQSDLFLWSMIPLVGFALIFLMAVVWGAVRPVETEKGGTK